MQLAAQLNASEAGLARAEVDTLTGEARLDIATVSFDDLEALIGHFAERRRVLTALLAPYGIALGDRIAAAIVRLAPEQVTLALYLGALVAGLRKVHGARIDAALLVGWDEALVAAGPVISRIDLIVSLRSVTAYLLDRIYEAARPRVMTVAMLLVVGDDGCLTATIVLAGRLGDAAEGISLALKCGADPLAYLAEVEVSHPTGSGSRTNNVGQIVSIAANPDPLIFGGGRVPNRPYRGTWELRVPPGSAMQQSSGGPVERLLILHVCGGGPRRRRGGGCAGQWARTGGMAARGRASFVTRACALGPWPGRRGGGWPPGPGARRRAGASPRARFFLEGARLPARGQGFKP